MNKQLATFIKGQRERKQEWRDKMAADNEEMKVRSQRKDKEIMPNLKSASAKDYKKWLCNFIENGGEPTHWYDYDLPDRFYIAVRDFKIIPLFGAMAIQIIIPVGIKVVGSLGHCDLYFMDEYKHHGWRIPVYNNTTF